MTSSPGVIDPDYAELLQLHAAYAAAVDAGDWDAWAELFIGAGQSHDS